MNRYCIYSRKSKATEKGESIENQIQACKEYIQRVDSRINVDEDIDVYIDEAVIIGLKTLRLKKCQKHAAF